MATSAVGEFAARSSEQLREERRLGHSRLLGMPRCRVYAGPRTLVYAMQLPGRKMGVSQTPISGLECSLRNLKYARCPGGDHRAQGRSEGAELADLLRQAKSMEQFLFLFLALPPPGVPGDGPDCHFPKEIGRLDRFRPGSGG